MDNTFTFNIPGYTITVVGTQPPAPTVEVIKDEIIENTDGTTETLEPAEAPAVETTEDAAPAA